MGVGRAVDEYPRRSLRDRDELPRQLDLPLLARAEPQRVVETVRSAGNARPVMPAGIQWLNDDSGDGLAALVPRHWRCEIGTREPPPRPPIGKPVPRRDDPAPQLDVETFPTRCDLRHGSHEQRDGDSTALSELRSSLAVPYGAPLGQPRARPKKGNARTSSKRRRMASMRMVGPRPSVSIAASILQAPEFQQRRAGSPRRFCSAHVVEIAADHSEAPANRFTISRIIRSFPAGALSAISRVSAVSAWGLSRCSIPSCLR